MYNRYVHSLFYTYSRERANDAYAYYVFFLQNKNEIYAQGIPNQIISLN